MNAKVAIVTGGGSGIGAATAEVLARDGASVLVCDLDVDSAASTAHLITSTGGAAMPFQMDVTDAQAHARAVAEAERLYGGLDIAVNCAGISVGPSKLQHTVQDTELSDWQRILDVNVNGVFYGMRAAVPMMIKRGGGSIVNVGSVMSVVARTKLSAYVTSKHAVLGLTKAAALDCAEHGIRVNAVGPGYVDTPLLHYKTAETRRAYAQLHPLGRLAKAGEVAELIAWLCSDKSSFTTGSFYAVDGGYSAV